MKFFCDIIPRKAERDCTRSPPIGSLLVRRRRDYLVFKTHYKGPEHLSYQLIHKAQLVASEANRVIVPQRTRWKQKLARIDRT